MARTYEWIVGATTYALSDGNPFYVENGAGLGLGPVRRLWQRSPRQDGHTDKGARLDPRYLYLVMWFAGASLAAADGHRDTLAEMFRPRTEPGKLRVTREDGAVRQVDAHFEGLMDWPTSKPDRLGVFQRFLVQLKAHDNVWYDPSLVNLGFETVIGATEGFQIPMQIPWNQVGATLIDATEVVNYAGNYREYPVVVITGPANDPVIVNTTTGEKLDFTGASIGGGDAFTITPRAKKVVDSSNVRQLDKLTNDSDLGTFHLEPGVNEIDVDIATGASTATRVSIQYYNRYVHGA